MVPLPQPIVKEVDFTPEYTREIRAAVVQNLVNKEKYTCKVDKFFPVIPREEGKYIHEIYMNYEPWCIEHSLFKDMIVKPDILEKCCAMDFNHTNVAKSVKNGEVMT